MSHTKLTLREVQYIIANKPLALVNLEHSKHNKKIVQKALTVVHKRPYGAETFKILREFLRDVAPKYELNTRQNGVRHFLLRELDRIEEAANRPRGLFASLASIFA